jgi:hypothetical protein
VFGHSTDSEVQTDVMRLSRLTEHMDEAASELAADPEETYEVAVGIASAADGCLADPTLAGAAADIRDTFGTWAQLIHTHGHPNGSTLGEAEAAHRAIAAAGRWRRVERS